jgi:hypothetical protein
MPRHSRILLLLGRAGSERPVALDPLQCAVHDPPGRWHVVQISPHPIGLVVSSKVGTAGRSRLLDMAVTDRSSGPSSCPSNGPWVAAQRWRCHGQIFEPQTGVLYWHARRSGPGVCYPGAYGMVSTNGAQGFSIHTGIKPPMLLSVLAPSRASTGVGVCRPVAAPSNPICRRYGGGARNCGKVIAPGILDC